MHGKVEKNETYSQIFLPGERPTENWKTWEAWKNYYDPGKIYELERMYWIEGYRIPARVYDDVLSKHEKCGRKEKDVYQEILTSWGSRVDERERAVRQRLAHRNHVHSFRELAEHILGILKDEVATGIREKTRKGMTAEEYIKLFPGFLQPFLRIRYAMDKRENIDSYSEVKKATSAIATYNNEAFL